MSEFADQVVLITGAKGGLGSSVTQAFLEAGATVVGSSRSIRNSDFASSRFVAIPSDLTLTGAARQMMDDALRRVPRIDALVHVMGGFAGGQAVQDTSDATWDQMMNINLRAAFHTLRAVIPHMRQAKRGRIVAIASRQALEPAANLSAYNVSKAGLMALVRTAALENKDLGITVNAILPGAMNTETNRQTMPDADASQWVRTEHVAALAVFLVSSAAAQITGAAVPIYGFSI